MAGHGEIFLDQVRAAQMLDMGVITMPTSVEARMSSQEANEMPWTEFRERIQPLAHIAMQPVATEYLLVPKQVGWTTRDVTIFVGRVDTEIHEIDDMSNEIGTEFLDLNGYVAEQLLATGNDDLVQVSIGFNPQAFLQMDQETLKPIAISHGPSLKELPF